MHAAAAFAIGPEAARQARAVLRLHMAEPQNLESLIDELQQAPHARAVTLGDMLDATGHRSFGPALLIPGLLLITPAGGIPGMATLVGMIALLASRVSSSPGARASGCRSGCCGGTRRTSSIASCTRAAGVCAPSFALVGVAAL